MSILSYESDDVCATAHINVDASTESVIFLRSSRRGCRNRMFSTTHFNILDITSGARTHTRVAHLRWPIRWHVRCFRLWHLTAFPSLPLYNYNGRSMCFSISVDLAEPSISPCTDRLSVNAVILESNLKIENVLFWWNSTSKCDIFSQHH